MVVTRATIEDAVGIDWDVVGLRPRLRRNAIGISQVRFFYGRTAAQETVLDRICDRNMLLL